MPFSTNTLVNVSRHILIYGGLSMILFGLFGSLVIIILFSRHPYNQSSSSIYIKINGVLSMCFLPLFYLPTIITNGFEIKLITINNAFCKFLSGYGAFTILSVLVINSFILFDRFAISSRSARIRSFSSKKIARILAFMGLLFVLCLIGIPATILFEKMPDGSNGTYICSSKSRNFLLFAALFYFPIVEGIMPVILTIYFWILTRRQVRNLSNAAVIRRLDRQLTRMYLFQILTNAIASVPYATINLYRSITYRTVRSQDKENIVQFFRLLSIWLFYVQYCTDFYTYIIVSKDMRLEALNLFHRCHRRVSRRFIAVRSIYFSNTQNLEISSH